MKRILIFAGTSEGRQLSECLSNKGVTHTVCVATEYGEDILKESCIKADVHMGRLDKEDMKAFIENGKYEIIIDATHPYATEVTKNIKIAADECDTEYIRLKRDIGINNNSNIIFADSHMQCINILKNTEGNILLTTGSKDLSLYCGDEELKNRLYVRVLPSIESINICKENDIHMSHIIAMQGPFNTAMNEALIKQYNICHMVTKMSGKNGGYENKEEAAVNTGISMYVVGLLDEENGLSYDEVISKLEELTGVKLEEKKKLEIALIGIGMGSKGNITKEAASFLNNAHVILGAKRMIEEYNPMVEKKPYYMPDDIINYLKDMKESKMKVAVLYSGDTGFYSGCSLLYKRLVNEIEADIKVYPGISSISYMAAKVGESYFDAAIYSMHGKELNNLANKIRSNKKIFMITSGVNDINRIGEVIVNAGFKDIDIIIGYQLSYPEEKVVKLTAKECMELKEEGLYVIFIRNNNVYNNVITCGVKDEEFLRKTGDIHVPMTKEEIRVLSICKLKLTKDSVVYDIGSGTGSVSIEIARLSDNIKVYAIEQKKEAFLLSNDNKTKFNLDNLKIIEGKAPDKIDENVIATHAFIGGSGGNLMEILKKLYKVNNNMRVVINAVTLETLWEIKQAIEELPVCDEEFVYVQVNKSKKAGDYHLMQANNGVWICSFYFKKD
ncbi:MAG: precorrin-6A reductase [Lachnospiraceae bacterium]|nr:precorrin-6A reductase [Lachnospiraceae bacterium]